MDSPVRPSRRQRLAAAALFTLGVGAVVVGSVATFKHAGLLAPFGFFLLIYAALIALAWLPSGRSRARLASEIREWVFENSSISYYGTMALALFACLEALTLASSFAGGGPGQWLRSAFTGWLMGFSLESLTNILRAVIWPWHLISRHGIWATAVFIVGTVSLFWVFGQLLPHEQLAKHLGPPVRRRRRAEPSA